MDENALSSYQNNAAIITEVVEQVRRDFGNFDLGIHYSGIVENAHSELLTQITQCIEDLAKSDPGRCSSLLYRIDIPEEQTVRALEELSFPETMARLIIQRELQKVLLRNHFGKQH